MPITAKQRELRRNKIGSSDAAAILGLDPFKTPADVWAEKVYATDDIKPTMPVKIGNHLERGLINIAAEELGVKIKVGEYRTCDTVPLFAANLDGRVVGKPEAVEAKVVGRNNPTISQWGDEGTDEVADHVMLQCQHQIVVANLTVVHVVAYIAGDLKMYRVEPHGALIDVMLRRCSDWWQQHIVLKQPPKDQTTSIDVLKRIRRSPKTVATLDRQSVETFVKVQQHAKHWEKQLEEHKARLIENLDDAEAGDWGDETNVYTYLEQTKRSIDEKKLRAEHPEIAQQYTRTTTFRVLRKQKRKVIDDYRHRDSTRIATQTTDDAQRPTQQRKLQCPVDGSDASAHEARTAGQDGVDGHEPSAEADGMHVCVADEEHHFGG